MTQTFDRAAKHLRQAGYFALLLGQASFAGKSSGLLDYYSIVSEQQHDSNPDLADDFGIGVKEFVAFMNSIIRNIFYFR